MKLNEQIFAIVQSKIDNHEIEGVTCWYDLVKSTDLHTNIKVNLKNNKLSLKTLDKLIDACDLHIEVH